MFNITKNESDENNVYDHKIASELESESESDNEVFNQTIAILNIFTFSPTPEIRIEMSSKANQVLSTVNICQHFSSIGR